jgi:beta-lactamase class A
MPLSLREAIDRRLRTEPGTVSVAFVDLGSDGTAFRDPDRRFHAASTMKVPVLIQLARDVDSGRTRWDDSIPVRNSFRSIVDGSPFTLDPADDSDSSLYALEGRPVSQRRLAELMIERSSNLATNILIAQPDPARVNATAHRLGADSIEVRRGVEDGKAYEKGLNNTTTARDLAVLLAAIATDRAASPAQSREILRMLLAQEFNEGIPAGLPPGTLVAHKTGNITALLHDAAIVYPPARPPYVLVVLTRGYPKQADAARVIADVSRIVYERVTAAPGGTAAPSADRSVE